MPSIAVKDLPVSLDAPPENVLSHPGLVSPGERALLYRLAREYFTGEGTIVDAGSVLFALTPSAQLIVFEASDKEFKQLASYKVAAGQTHAYPVASGNRIFIKDKDSLTLWIVE